MISALSYFQFLEITQIPLTRISRLQHVYNTTLAPRINVTTSNCKILECTFVSTGIGLIDVIFFSQKFLNSLDKSDKGVIFDVVTSCSLLDK